ncbi:MAG: sulfatase [Anaerolineae bacterium]|nr:sulfatase [Anaerolineae bacterium]
MDIVLLVFDTLRADRLSGYGYSRATSPWWDKTAAGATVYKQAISPAHWTLPAHASLFTGLYPSQHTMVDMNSALPSTIPTLAERLRQAGYATVAISNNPLIGAQRNGLQRGFERIENYSFMRFALWNAHLNSPMATRPSLRGRIKQLRGKLAHWMGYDGTAPTWPWTVLQPLMEVGLKKLGGEKYRNTQRSLDLAAHLLINRPKIGARPLFLFINLMGAHTPYEPPAWALKDFVVAPNAQALRKSLHTANLMQLDPANWLAAQWSDEDALVALNAVYDAEVAAQDRCFGDFITQLQTSGASDRILLIATSDHGEHLGEKQRLSHIFGAYQPLVRVPLLICNPQDGVTVGENVEAFVSTRRLFHTILSAANAATPAERSLSLIKPRGADFALVLDAAPEFNQAFSEAIAPPVLTPRLEVRRPGIIAAYHYEQPVRAIFAGEHKLIDHHGHHAELYTVRTDVAESHDLAAYLPDRIVELTDALQSFVAQHPTLAPSTETLTDAEVTKRLRMLGYLE